MQVPATTTLKRAFIEPQKLSRRNNSSSSTFHASPLSQPNNSLHSSPSQSHIKTQAHITPTFYRISSSSTLDHALASSNASSASSKPATARRRKIVVVGDGGIGKTTILAHYSTGRFLDDYVPTVFQNTHVLVQLGAFIYSVALWDTAGQDDYSRLRPLSYPGTDAFLVCFAINDPDSFSNVRDKWLAEIKHHSANVPVILVGLKCDLRDSLNEQASCIGPECGLQLVELGLVNQYVECSALTQFQIEKPIEAALVLSDKEEAIKKKKSCKMM